MAGSPERMGFDLTVLVAYYNREGGDQKDLTLRRSFLSGFCHDCPIGNPVIKTAIRVGPDEKSECPVSFFPLDRRMQLVSVLSQGGHYGAHQP